MFTKAAEWNLWDGRNPCEGVNVSHQQVSEVLGAATCCMWSGASTEAISMISRANLRGASGK